MYQSFLKHEIEVTHSSRKERSRIMSPNFARCITLLDEQNEEGETALNLTVKNNDYTIASIILEFSGNANIPNHQGITPLHRAAKYGNHFLCTLLLQKGGVITRDIQGLTPLHMAALSDSVKSFQVLAVNQSYINAASDAGVTVAHLASLSKAGKVCKLLHQNNVSFTIATHDFFHYDHIKIIAGTTALELIGATLDTIPASERKQSALDEIQFFLKRKLARSESDQSAATTPKPINKSQEDFAKIRDLSEQYRRAREIKKAQEDQEKEQLRIKEEESHRRMKEGIEQRRKERENIKIAEEAKNRQDEERRRKNFEARQKRDAARQFSTSSQQPTPAPELERPHSSTPLVNLSDNQTLIDELIGLEERKVKQLQELERTSVGSYNYEEKSKRINAAFARDVKSYMIQSIEDPTASEQLKIKRSKLKIHPDKNPGNEEKANRAMKIMGDAFAILDTRSSFR